METLHTYYSDSNSTLLSVYNPLDSKDTASNIMYEGSEAEEVWFCDSDNNSHLVWKKPDTTEYMYYGYLSNFEIENY